MAGIQSLLTLSAGKRAKWVVLGLWVAALALLAPLAADFESVQQNEQSSFLPSKAESTQVLALERQFRQEEVTPAIIVYRRESALTAADRARATADQREILAQRVEGVLPQPIPLQPSADGKAVLLVVPIAPGGNVDALNEAVATIRDRVSGDEGGLQVRVTGPAGFLADAVEVFGSLDVRLLLSTVAVVTILLLFTYRSPFLWMIPLAAVAFAEFASRGVGYLLADNGVTINGQSAGLLTVLVFGAGTDYALLLTARYREELRRHEDKHVAMRQALVSAGPAILASAGTVAVALLCLLVAELNSNRGLGPVGAMGIGLALLAMVTALPALLLIFGRLAFWPYVPRYGTEVREASGFFGRAGRLIAPRPRVVWVGTVALLGVMALGLLRTDTGLNSLEGFRSSVESVEGQNLLAQSFPGGASAPTSVIVQPAARADEALAAARNTPNVARVGPIEPALSGDLARFDVTLASEPFGAEAFDTITALRENVKQAAGAGALVGGDTAEERDVREASARDSLVIVPLILVAVLAILALLLRSIIAPLMLMATVILSFAAAFGVSILVYEYVFGFPGIDPSLPLLAFLFLVALGVDYNIFLMARVREEAERYGTREGMLRGLAVTGGVITSAGLVLAGTFAVLAVLPLVALTEIGFVVAFGVLLDTLIVRTVLVPALTIDLGRRVWWPGALSRQGQEPTTEHQPLVPATEPAQ